jgi:hypothetical protein
MPGSDDEPELGRPRYLATPPSYTDVPRQPGPAAAVPDAPHGAVPGVPPLLPEQAGEPDGAAAPLPKTEPVAVAAFAFAILGWTILPLLGSIVAIKLARTAGERIQAAADDREGVGLALFAKWAGWANVWAVVVAAVVALTPILHLLGIHLNL